jgi:Cytochrome c7 and related cytochrome c
MKDNFYENIKVSVILTSLYLVLLSGCKNKESDTIELNKVNTENEVSIGTAQTNDYAVEAPPFSDGIFPCTDCHKNLIPNPVRRVLVDWHDDISAMFNHDSENRWCLDCHDLKNRDSLRLASGKLLDFKESYKLCGQCHGEKYRDWKVGVHGQRTGEWNGKKEYLLCVNCHNPHSPKFRELTPEAPPIMQEDIK